MNGRPLLKKLYGDDATVRDIIMGMAVPRLHLNTRAPWRTTCERCGVSLIGQYPPPHTDNEEEYNQSPYKCTNG